MAKLKYNFLVLFLMFAISGCQKNQNPVTPESTNSTPESLDKITINRN